MTISKVIRQNRIDAGLSQREFAEKVGWFNQSQISKIETNRRRVSTKDLDCIAKALNVPTAELINQTQTVEKNGMIQDKPPKVEWRRFIILHDEKRDELETMLFKKNLSREDLFLILENMAINPNVVN